MTDPKRILFYVQHLLGIGHLRRTATLSRNLVRAGFQVTIVSGGHPIDIDLGGADLVQLPATRATDLFFKKLVDEDGQEIDDGWRDMRAGRLLEIYGDVQPDILITELFPLVAGKCGLSCYLFWRRQKRIQGRR